MKVQKIKLSRGYGWALLDSDYQPVREANRFMRYLYTKKYSPNTLRLYMYSLKHYYEYLKLRGISLLGFLQSGNLSLLSMLLEFSLYLENDRYGEKVIRVDIAPRVSDKTSTTYISAVLSFYEFLALETGEFSMEGFAGGRKTGEIRDFLSELTAVRKTIRRKALHKVVLKTDPKYISRTELMDILNYCTCLRDKALLCLLFESGIRLGEALGIKLEDLVLEDNRVEIQFREDNPHEARVKNQSSRAVFIPDYLCSFIAEYLVSQSLRHQSEFLFLVSSGPNKGQPLSGKSADNIFRGLSKRSGHKLHAHMFRHGHAVERIEDGFSLEEISLLLGHKNVSSTNIYAHISKRYEMEKLRPSLEANFSEALG